MEGREQQACASSGGGGGAEEGPQPSASGVEQPAQPPRGNTSTVVSIWESLFMYPDGEEDALEAALRPLFADDVTYQQQDAPNGAYAAGLQYMRPRTGLDDSIRHFRDQRQYLQVNKVVVHRMLEAEDKVLAWFTMDAVSLRTGRQLVDDMLIEWTFNEAGKIRAVRQWIDTAKHIEVHSQAGEPAGGAQPAS